jgi:hypothetical protein
MSRHPVAFFVFNRPQETKLVFESIRKSKPPTLLLVADGPQNGSKDDERKSFEVRQILNDIDWDCQVFRDYSDTNMGCRLRISSGLDWVFSQVEEAIILEDDCLPNPSFFEFCDLLLDQYKDDDRILSISGTTFQPASRKDPNSYYFSQYPHIWGWASWRRAWKLYDVDIKSWQDIRDHQKLANLISDPQVRLYWHNKFQKIYHKKIDTWDFQLIFASFIHNGLHIIPNQNLVSNIGFNLDATHTKKRSKLADRLTNTMIFPLNNPDSISQDIKADKFTESYLYECQIYRRLWNRINSYRRN